MLHQFIGALVYKPLLLTSTVYNPADVCDCVSVAAVEVIHACLYIYAETFSPCTESRHNCIFVRSCAIVVSLELQHVWKF